MSTAMKQRDMYAPPRHDAYIVLLIISLVAIILGCGLLYLDYSSYPSKEPPAVAARQPAAAQPQTGAGGQQQPQQPQNPPGADGGQKK